jgi:hypothetical protein
MEFIGSLKKYTRDGVYQRIGTTSYAITKKCVKCGKEKIVAYEEADWKKINDYDHIF